MSDEQKENDSPPKADDAPPKADDTASEKPAKPAPAKAAGEGGEAKKPPPKKEAPPPEPPKPGPYCKLLESKGFHPVPLGEDAGKFEMIELKPEELRDACLCLRDDANSMFDLLLSVSGVDNQDKLTSVYHLYSTQRKAKVVLKSHAINDKLPSVVSVWPGADWHERETYDLFGITYEGHPNLTRILMPDDWIGHPLRKDYTVDDPRLVWNER